MPEEKNMPSRRKSVRKKSKGPLIVVIALLVLAVVGASAVYRMVFNNTAPVDTNRIACQEIIIDKGASTKRIAAILEEEGLINSSLSFQMYVKSHDYDGKLRNGTYQLSPSMSVEEIVEILLNGIGETVKFTIPEGYTLEEIAEVLMKENIMTVDDFWEVVVNGDFSQYDFLPERPADRHRLEGYLFPDTYIIAKGASTQAVVNAMLNRFSDVKESLPENTSGLSLDEVVILASLVEAEGRVDEERAIIASVYLNRIETKMPLQCDATIQYALPEHKNRLYYSDYEHDSPYNTYLFTGFPPTAICNPGAKSLAAACQPADTEYFYYLWDKSSDGTHVFAKTYEEHVKNRRKYGYN